LYDIPAPEELRKFMAENNLTGADMAALTGVSARTARRWVVPSGQKGSVPIPWAAWAMVLILTGKKTKEEFLKQINAWKSEKIGLGLFERGKPGRRWPEKKEKEQ
jgi:hypothetical protein